MDVINIDSEDDRSSIDKIIQSSPKKGLYKFINRLMNSENLTTAKAICRRMLSRDAKNPDFHLIMGDIYYLAENNFAVAQRYYVAALMLGAKSECYNALASLYNDHGNPEAAEYFYQAALLYRNEPKDKFALARFYLKNKRLDESIALLRGVKKDLDERRYRSSRKVLYTLVCEHLIEAYNENGDILLSRREKIEFEKRTHKGRPYIAGIIKD